MGKSSLLNRLSRRERAIVTDLPGTTRDLLESEIVLEGVPITLLDTAGIRSTDDAVEQLGIARSEEALATADVVLLVLDGHAGWTAEDAALLARIPEQIPRILVANKADLPAGAFPQPVDVQLSALEGTGEARSGAGPAGALWGSRDRRHVGGAEPTPTRSGGQGGRGPGPQPGGGGPAAALGLLDHRSAGGDPRTGGDHRGRTHRSGAGSGVFALLHRKIGSADVWNGLDWQSPALTAALEAWLAEDIGRGDLTAAALQGQQGQAHWVAKQPGLFCGGPLVQRLFQRLDPAVSLRLLRQDGDAVEAGDCLLELQGPATALVAGERTALNLAMRLSGIATATAALVAQLEGSGVRLADTRKTTPGLRLLEKYAVRCGGGINHRMGLDDAAMLKENHIAWGGRHHGGHRGCA